MSIHPNRLRLNQINNKIRELEEERDTMQKECKHESYRIVNYSWRIGALDVVRLCTICDNHLGLASHDECKIFQTEEKKGEGFAVYDNVPPVDRINYHEPINPFNEINIGAHECTEITDDCVDRCGWCRGRDINE